VVWPSELSSGARPAAQAAPQERPPLEDVDLSVLKAIFRERLFCMMFRREMRPQTVECSGRWSKGFQAVTSAGRRLASAALHDLRHDGRPRILLQVGMHRAEAEPLRPAPGRNVLQKWL